jgi:hypothetical protein
VAGFGELVKSLSPHRHSGARVARARNPYSRWWLWIPGSRLCRASEFVVNKSRRNVLFSPRIVRPSFAESITLFEKQRAQGRPGADCTHGPRATRKHAAEPQVRAGHPAFPARWLYGLLRALPGDRRSCPRPRDAKHHRVATTRKRVALASAPGCQDHTAWPCASNCSSARHDHAATRRAHRIPPPRS